MNDDFVLRDASNDLFVKCNGQSDKYDIQPLSLKKIGFGSARVPAS